MNCTNTLLKRGSCCLTVLFFAAFAVADDKPAAEKKTVTLEAGDVAPVFTGNDSSGKKWKSSDSVGKKYLVVYFYPADFTTGCTKQALVWRDNLNTLVAKGVKVIGISGDSVRNHQLFKKTWKLNFTLLSDEDASIAKKFGVPTRRGGRVRPRGPDRKPLTDGDGKPLTLERKATFARWTFIIGKDGNILYKNMRVRPAKDSQVVLEFIKGLRGTKSKSPQPTYSFYTVSRNGILFHLEVGKRILRKTIVAKLGKPFIRPSVSVEGLAISREGILYASTVFRSKFYAESKLYAINPSTGKTRYVGDITAGEVDGLDFGPDGKLYGVISSCRESAAVSLKQLVVINPATGKATSSSTKTDACFGDLDAIAIDQSGNAIIPNGTSGLLQVVVTSEERATPYYSDIRFRRFLRDNDQMEGLCFVRGRLFGVCNKHRSILVHIDARTKTVTKLGDLGFASLNLAATLNKRNPESLPVVARRPR